MSGDGGKALGKVVGTTCALLLGVLVVLTIVAGIVALLRFIF